VKGHWKCLIYYRELYSRSWRQKLMFPSRGSLKCILQLQLASLWDMKEPLWNHLHVCLALTTQKPNDTCSQLP
jgi:hypothetical protein